MCARGLSNIQLSYILRSSYLKVLTGFTTMDDNEYGKEVQVHSPEVVKVGKTDCTHDAEAVNCKCANSRSEYLLYDEKFQQPKYIQRIIHERRTKIFISHTNKKTIQERESFQRINFLIQAAQLMSAQSPRAKSIPSFYGSIIHGIAQKSLIRLHPDVKRQMCRGCKSLLLPGSSAKVSVRSHPCCQVIWTCLLCRTFRRMPAKRGYRLWVQRQDAVVPQ